MSYSSDHRIHYDVEVDWNVLPKHTNSLIGIADNIEILRFRREKNSHRGISRLARLRKLVAFCVNQECLEEISCLPMLETIYLSQLTADNLTCLGRCRTLRHLIIKGGTKIVSLAWLATLPALDSLLLENLKRVTDIFPILSIPSLSAFGYEGSMWTTQRVESLQPIAGLPNLEALFLNNCRPGSDGMQPLHRLASLRYLEIAAFYPDAAFLALRQALPKLECHWLKSIDQYGSIRAAIKARTLDLVHPT